MCLLSLSAEHTTQTSYNFYLSLLRKRVVETAIQAIGASHMSLSFVEVPPVTPA